MIFLGMQRKPKSPEELAKDPLKLQNETMRNRKDLQENTMIMFERAKEELKDKEDQLTAYFLHELRKPAAATE